MKKLIIVLLVGILTLGLSGVAFATTSGDQTISAKINRTLTLTVPNPLSGWVLEPNTTAATGGTNTTYDNTSATAVSSFAAKVQTNAPYTLSVKASGVDTPTGEGAADAYMTTSYDETPATDTAADLKNALELKYNTTGSNDVPDAVSTTFDTTLAEVTTGDQQFVAVSAPESGFAYVSIEFGQTTTDGDVAYKSDNTQVSYSIQLTWTAASKI